MSTEVKAAETKRVEELAGAIDWSKVLALLAQYAPIILEWFKKLFPKSVDGEHVSYPTSFPLECVTEASQIVLGGMGSVQARLPEFGQHVWNVQGYLQGVILGLPDPSPFADAPPVSEQIAALEALLKNLEAVNAEPAHAGVDGSFAEAAAIDPTFILLLIQLIKAFLERFKPKV